MKNERVNHKMDDRIRIGRMGEQKVVEHLRNESYTIVEKNWLCRSGEIDIIAEWNNTLIFVEVRTRRSTHSYGTASESVNAQKQQKIRNTAQVYLHRTKKYEHSIRFDVIAVQMNSDEEVIKLDHIINAF